MSVPQYSDLGKTARDVFRTGYAYDVAKVEQHVLKDPYNFDFGGNLNLRSFKGGASFSGKYDTKGYGELSGKYEFQGPIWGEYKWRNLIVDNLDLNLGCSFNPTELSHTFKAGSQFHNAHLHATGSLTKDHERSPDVLCTGVVKLPKNLFLGYQAGYNTSTAQLTKNDVSFAFEEEDVGVHLRCIQLTKEFGLSGRYKVNDKTDVAFDSKVALQEDAKPWFLGAGLAYKLDEHCKLRLKFDKNLQLGTSIQLSLQENVKLSLAFNLDLHNVTGGQHKVGLGLDVTG